GVGYGSAVVRPYHDANFNGRMDPEEEELAGLRARISGVGGRPVGENQNFFYDRLRPYDEYVVQIDQYSLDDPTMRPSYENYKVMFSPNVVTSIDVPIVTASEISGKVERVLPDGRAGQGGVVIHVVNLSKDVLTEITTFSDGEYFYLGLLPGKYRAYIDEAQLSRLGYTADPPSIEFEVAPTEGGDVIENASFLLVPRVDLPVEPEQ
ncbi:MAG: hypothetical protein KKA42_01475, partial [candidate division Zixibacteria bacterium]|nr:hypothetical protein [candidate division Zixibacteria bacterium]